MISRQRGSPAAGADVVESVEVAFALAGSGPVFVVGGGEIYTQTMDLADALELTEVHRELAGDVLFPAVDRTTWSEVTREPGDGTTSFATNGVQGCRRSSVLGQVWRLLGGTNADLAGLEIDGPDRVLSGPLPSTELATAAVAAALLAAAGRPRCGPGTGRHTPGHPARGGCRSQRTVPAPPRPAARPPVRPVVGVLPHGGRLGPVARELRHHQAALLRVLGLPVGSPADVDRATARIARWAGADLEEALAAEGGVGAVVRTRQEWEDHAAGRAALSQPIVDLQPGGSVAPVPPPMPPSAGRRGTRSRTALPAWGFASSTSLA